MLASLLTLLMFLKKPDLAAPNLILSFAALGHEVKKIVHKDQAETRASGVLQTLNIAAALAQILPYSGLALKVDLLKLAAVLLL